MSTWVSFTRALRRKLFTWRWIYFIFKIKINASALQSVFVFDLLHWGLYKVFHSWFISEIYSNIKDGVLVENYELFIFHSFHFILDCLRSCFLELLDLIRVIACDFYLIFIQQKAAPEVRNVKLLNFLIQIWSLRR